MFGVSTRCRWTLVAFAVAVLTGGATDAAAAWMTFQADAAHTGHVPGHYAFRRAQLLWQTAVAPNAPNGLAVGDGAVFVTVPYPNIPYPPPPSIHALDQMTGSTLWSSTFLVSTLGPPAYFDGAVYFQVDGGGPNLLEARAAQTGASLFSAPYDAQFETYLNPTPFGSNVYVGGGYYGGMYSFDATTGARNWFGGVPQYDGWTPAIDGRYAYAYTGVYNGTIDGLLIMLNVCDGTNAAAVYDPVYVWTGYTMHSAVVLGPNHDAFTINGGRLVSWDTTLDASHTPHIRWSITAGFSGQPSLARGALYVVANGGLAVLDENTGQPRWTWTPPSGAIVQPPIVTDNLVFVSTATDTFAIGRSGKHNVVWSYPVSGMLAFSNNRLYVAGTDGTVSAFGRGRMRPDPPPRSSTTLVMCTTTTTSTTTTTTTTPPTTTTTTIPACTFVLQMGTRLGASDGELVSPWGVATDGGGHVYVADAGNNRIQKFDADGAFLTRWGSAGSQPGQFGNTLAVAADPSGNVYVADSDNARVQKFDSAGNFITAWGSAGTGPGQFGANFPLTVAADASAVYVAETYYARIDKFDTNGNFLNSWGSSGTGNGQFGFPTAIGTDSSGNVYVADAGLMTDRIQKFDGNGAFLQAWGSPGSGNGQLENPSGVTIDAAGNVYVSDLSNFRVQKFDATGGFLAAWGSRGSASGQFDDPEGIAADGNGNVYVADEFNDRIEKFDTSGTFLAQWGAERGAPGELGSPVGVAVDGSGNVYVTDAFFNRVQKFDGAGAFVTMWGSAGSAIGQFENPYAVAVDSSGNAYVTDAYNNRVQKFDSVGNFVTAWGSYGSGDGQFRQPAGVAVDGNGNVYVTDLSGQRIEKFDANGVFLATWGSGGFGNGLYFAEPDAIATDAAGNVYVADAFGNRVDKFDASTAFVTTWGVTGPYGIATDASGHVYVSHFYVELDQYDASGTLLGGRQLFGAGPGEFNEPRGVATDASGNVYVADSSNGRIQKFVCP